MEPEPAHYLHMLAGASSQHSFSSSPIKTSSIVQRKIDVTFAALVNVVDKLL